MFAIIETGGKQYKVEEGQVIEVEKLDRNVGDTINFDVLLLAKKGVTQKVVLHVLNADTTIQKVEIAVTDSMFIEII